MNTVINGTGHAPFIRCPNITKITLTPGKNGFNYVTSSTSGRYIYTPWYLSREKAQTIIIEKGIESIGTYTFYGLTNATFYYTGSESDWENVTIGANNNSLTNAVINYNYTE